MAISGDEVRNHTHCLLSGSEKLKPLKGYEQAHLVKSSPLGFVFCSRIPTEEELVRHYEGYPRNNYLSPITVKRYHELLDEFEQYRKTGKLLDIGCGIGLFLNEAKKRGWEVYGTEYTETAVNICRSLGINMHHGKLESDTYPADQFDVVTSFEVLEHINNPQEEIKNIKKIVRPGGLFYFTTPNFNSIERYILKSKYNVIQYPEHLCYYTKKTVNYLLTQNGFKKKKLKTTGVSLTRLKTSLGNDEDYVSATSTDEIVRQKFEKNGIMQFIKKALNFLLDQFGLGFSMKGWYVKKATA